MAVMGRQLGPRSAQIHLRVELAHQMIRRNQPIEAVLIENLALFPFQSPHHRSVFLHIAQKDRITASNNDQDGVLQQNPSDSGPRWARSAKTETDPKRPSWSPRSLAESVEPVPCYAIS